MRMKINEMPRATEGDTIELEGTVSFAQKPNEGQYGWSQFIGVKDDTGEQRCWIRLEGEEDKVTKGTSIKIKGKLGDEYKDRKSGDMVRSINNCDFEVGKMQEPAQSSEKSVQSTQGNGKVDDKVWREKDLRMARESALKNITQFVVAKIIKLDHRFKYAQEDVDFIYKDMKQINGKEERIEEAKEDWSTEKQVALIKKSIITSHLLTEPEKEKIEGFFEGGLTNIKAGEIICWWLGDIVENIEGQRSIRGKAEDLTKAEKIEKAKKIIKAHSSVEIKDKEAPFPDEGEPGISPDNAVPLKSKKKVSKAEDFISDGKIPF